MKRVCMVVVIALALSTGSSDLRGADIPGFDGFSVIDRSAAHSVEIASADTILGRLDMGALRRSNPKLHSFAVLDVETGELRSSHWPPVRPRSVASTIKLAVVNATLREVSLGRISLNETLTVVANNVQSYDGEAVGRRYTVAEAIHATLIRSSNTCPNLLAVRLGGLSKLNAILQDMGYADTRYNYLSSLKRTEWATAGSTARDMALVARDFYTTWRHVQGLGNKTAWHGFANAKDMIEAEGHETLGGKIGSNSLSCSNTGLFEIAGRVYAIVVMSEENGLANNYAADAYLVQGSTSIANAVATSARRGR